MMFANFSAIHCFWALPALICFFLWSDAKKRRVAASFARKDFLPELTLGLDRRRTALGRTAVLISLSLIILAAMRPQSRHSGPEERVRADILFAVDTSKSMLSRDVRPNRLRLAKAEVRELAESLQGARIGLIAFSGGAFLECPLTTDYNGFMISLDGLDVGTITKAGTSLATAIKAALGSYLPGTGRNKILFILSDGEDHAGDVLSSARSAKEEGIRIFTVGIGTERGDFIPAEYESAGFLKDRSGNEVRTSLNEHILRQIASTARGRYMRMDSANLRSLRDFADEIAGRGENGDIATGTTRELYQVPLLFAVFLLCIEPLLEKRKKGPAPSREAALKIAKGMLAVLFLIQFPAIASAIDTRALREGNELYYRGQYREAFEKYTRGRPGTADSPVLNFNIGTTLYKLGKYKEAADAFEKALRGNKADIAKKALYNIGNCKYKIANSFPSANTAEVPMLYRESLEYYRRAMDIDKAYSAAAYNSTFVSGKLKEAEKRIRERRSRPEKAESLAPPAKGMKNGENTASGPQGEQRAARAEQGKGRQSVSREEKGKASHASSRKTGMSAEDARLLIDNYAKEETAKIRHYVARSGRSDEVTKDW